jgi:hypothetical protein
VRSIGNGANAYVINDLAGCDGAIFPPENLFTRQDHRRGGRGRPEVGVACPCNHHAILPGPCTCHATCDVTHWLHYVIITHHHHIHMSCHVMSCHVGPSHAFVIGDLARPCHKAQEARSVVAHRWTAAAGRSPLVRPARCLAGPLCVVALGRIVAPSAERHRSKRLDSADSILWIRCNCRVCSHLAWVFRLAFAAVGFNRLDNPGCMQHLRQTT